MEPPAGDAPPGFLYKRNPQAAAWRRRWSQSPVLPWAGLAYDACPNAGSTAIVLKLEPPTRNCTELAPIPKECIAQNALGARKLASLTGFAP